MRSTYDIDARYTGAGNLAEYGFTSKIEALDHLLIIILSDAGAELARFRGDGTGDTLSYLDTVEFNPVDGGGTVYLNDDLTTNHEILILLANDEPVQTRQYRTQGSFGLKDFEMALDYIIGAVQRISWLALRSIRLHDSYEDAFEMQLPVTLTPGAAIVINDDGDGLAMGQTADLDAFITSGPFTCLQNASTALTDETHSGAAYDQVDYEVKVKRGTTVFAKCRFTIFFRNSAWELADDPDLYANNPSGLTFTVHATTGQITAVVDNSGAGNATLYIKKLRWAA